MYNHTSSNPTTTSEVLLMIIYKKTLAVHTGAFGQFPFRWIYYYGSNKSTGKETDKMPLCAVPRKRPLNLSSLKIHTVDFILNYIFEISGLH